jgi:hypothetical protein
MSFLDMVVGVRLYYVYSTATVIFFSIPSLSFPIHFPYLAVSENELLRSSAQIGLYYSNANIHGCQDYLYCLLSLAKQTLLKSIIARCKEFAEAAIQFETPRRLEEKITEQNRAISVGPSTVPILGVVIWLLHYEQAI